MQAAFILQNRIFSNARPFPKSSCCLYELTEFIIAFVVEISNLIIL